ncbi:molybdate transport system substrate-binding protein [Amycolatopsis arida]|uniref:Molybdate transport system substrate-binding protein n=1 Tax=Amycolatopsis arida TaxID=587909 RepID=A0A1I5QN55_9PSEU|nr:molybdate ABC transporter substrate-binding protein [Amycolatopsis arida]TDX98903.1 molybdate transport system substrate-binding protein [Amycolatopsis arida]SFP47652.1 molybdate transport system substrate-binding protein [Amycolatopsis arida]
MRRPAAVLLAAVLVATGCAGAAGGTTLTVFAAASLTESFGALEHRFEADHPGVDVRLNLGGSARLAQQIAEGAPADVFAAADPEAMRRAGERVAEPAVFATNRLTVVVAPGNPLGVTGLADLARPDVTTVVCAPRVPCGAAAQRLAALAGAPLRPASEEQDVKAVLNKVRVGAADAGLVYVTDAPVAAGAVDTVEIPAAERVVNDYPIAVLRDAPAGELARAFVDLVLGPVGREELAARGFGTP